MLSAEASLVLDNISQLRQTRDRTIGRHPYPPSSVVLFNGIPFTSSHFLRPRHYVPYHRAMIRQ